MLQEAPVPIELAKSSYSGFHFLVHHMLRSHGQMKLCNMFKLFLLAVFKELQKESEFQRKEWFRKQGEPH